MKTIIAGSRTATNYNDLLFALGDINWKITTVLSGGARGADKLGERLALENCIPLKIYPANWEKHGKSAGYIRNLEMAKEGEALIALWDGGSKGTKHMIKLAREFNLRIHITYV